MRPTAITGTSTTRFTAAAAAHQRLEQRLNVGKVLLTPEAVTSILVNLVENARKYASVGSAPAGCEPIRIVTRLERHYADFDGLVRDVLRTALPEVSGRSERRELYRLISIGAGYQLRDIVVANPDLVGQTQTVWVPASSNVDMLLKGNIDAELDESLRPLSDNQIAWVRALEADGRLALKFNTALFTNGDSREPELAGIERRGPDTPRGRDPGHDQGVDPHGGEGGRERRAEEP